MAPRSKSKQVKPSERASAWGVYMLRCGDGSLYTGATNSVEARLLRHQAGRGAAYTRSRLPVTLVFWEPVGEMGAALRREHALKQLPRPLKLALVRGARGSRSKRRALRVSRPAR